MLLRPLIKLRIYIPAEKKKKRVT
eukprot:SAG11_NODE_1580_length_4651_cov_5.701011_1_plen_23_part_10